MISQDLRSRGQSSQTVNGDDYLQDTRDLRGLFGADTLARLVLLDSFPKSRTTDAATEWVWFGTRDEGCQGGLLRGFSYDVIVDRQALNKSIRGMGA